MSNKTIYELIIKLQQYEQIVNNYELWLTNTQYGL